MLLAAAGLTNKEIATRLGTREPVVGRWRKRFAEHRLAGLTEKAGRGRKPQYGVRTVKKIVDATVKTTPGAGDPLEYADDGQGGRCEPYNGASDLERPSEVDPIFRTKIGPC